MEEHMQRKLLGVCYWTSVILGTKNESFFTPATVEPEKSIYWQCHLLTACGSVPGTWGTHHTAANAQFISAL